MDIFSKIAAGEIPSYKCAEDEQFYAFLDINPLAKGHTLVIPRREVDYIFDMEDDEIAAFQVFAKKVAVALKKAFPCKKVAQVVLGLEVPHAHLHLIPMNSEGDVDFRKEKLSLTEEEFKEISQKFLTGTHTIHSGCIPLSKSQSYGFLEGFSQTIFIITLSKYHFGSIVSRSPRPCAYHYILHHRCTSFISYEDKISSIDNSCIDVC